MKQYLKEITDPRLLGNADDKSESLMVMGVSNLEDENFKKALSLFDSALERTHKAPGAWLGKAYAESLLSSSDREFFESIKRSFQHVYDLHPEKELMLRHYSAVLSILLERGEPSGTSATGLGPTTGTRARGPVEFARAGRRYGA